MNSLQRLLQDRRATLGDSLADCARRSGGRVTRQVLHRWETVPLRRPPEADSVTAVADAYDLPVRVVRQAMLESVGLSERRIPNTDIKVLTAAVDERLTAAQQRAWVRIARAALESIEAGDQ